MGQKIVFFLERALFRYILRNTYRNVTISPLKCRSLLNELIAKTTTWWTYKNKRLDEPPDT